MVLFNFEYPLTSKDGKEIFAIGVSRRAEVVRYNLRTHEFVPYLSGISAEGLAFSPDGQWLAYTSYPDGTLWRSRVDGTERLQLTLPPMKVFMPRWSPDGRQIAFNALLPEATWNIYVISSTGGSAERQLPSDQSQLDVDWSPDGKSLIFGTIADPKRSIYILDIRSKRISTLPDSIGFYSPHWSPNGKYISAKVSETRKLMIFDVSAQKWTRPCDCTADHPMLVARWKVPLLSGLSWAGQALRHRSPAAERSQDRERCRTQQCRALHRCRDFRALVWAYPR